MSDLYNIQLNALAQWLIPTRLRIGVLLAFVKAAFAPLVSLHNEFIAFRKAKLYQIAMNYQTCYLEAFLNDRFDFSQRRIYIGDPDNPEDPLYLYQEAEDDPLYLYTEAENSPVYLFTENEIIGDLLYDFIVFVPSGLVFNEDEMRAMISTKISGKRYKIELF